MNIITLTFSKEKIKIFLTFLFDLFFLAVVLVWNRQLAVLIDLVTSGQTVTKSIIDKINPVTKITSKIALIIFGHFLIK